MNPKASLDTMAFLMGYITFYIIVGLAGQLLGICICVHLICLQQGFEAKGEMPVCGTGLLKYDLRSLGRENDQMF